MIIRIIIVDSWVPTYKSEQAAAPAVQWSKRETPEFLFLEKKKFIEMSRCIKISTSLDYTRFLILRLLSLPFLFPMLMHCRTDDEVKR